MFLTDREQIIVTRDDEDNASQVTETK